MDKLCIVIDRNILLSTEAPSKTSPYNSLLFSPRRTVCPETGAYGLGFVRPCVRTLSVISLTFMYRCTWYIG